MPPQTGEIKCKIKGNFRLKGIRTTNPVAVGDRVEVRVAPDGSAFITAICPRKNYIIRRASNLSKEASILAANVDLAVIVATLKHPLTSTNFIDRFLATAEDLNPDTRFVDNALVKIIRESAEMESYFTDNPFNWSDYPEFIRSIHAKVLESQLYADYMVAESTDLEKDCDFWRAVMKNIILPSDDLAELLESMSVFWNDDLDITGTFVIKTIKRIGSGKEGKILLPQYKDDEDAAFGGELFVDTIENFDLYRSYIDKFIDARQWDTDRLAFMDVVIMATAIDELLHYPAIPIPVTLNEYIEIANCYSTPRSGQFVNGILYSVINYLKEEGKLNKN